MRCVEIQTIALLTHVHHYSSAQIVCSGHSMVSAISKFCNHLKLDTKIDLWGCMRSSSLVISGKIYISSNNFIVVSINIYVHDLS